MVPILNDNLSNSCFTNPHDFVTSSCVHEKGYTSKLDTSESRKTPPVQSRHTVLGAVQFWEETGRRRYRTPRKFQVQLSDRKSRIGVDDGG